MAYSIALTKMGKDSNTWIGTCCKEADKKLSSLGFNLTADPYRISVWNRVFQKDGEFPHPNHYVANGMKPKLPIFDVFPETAAMTSEFIYSHLDHLTVEMLRNELITNIIPGLKKRKLKMNRCQLIEANLFCYLGFQPSRQAGQQSYIGSTLWDSRMINLRSRIMLMDTSTKNKNNTKLGSSTDTFLT